MTISEYAQKFIGKSYVWGGDGSGKCGGGFDCSGLVLECLWAFGILPKGDMTAQGIFKALRKEGWSYATAGKEKADNILFFGKDREHITHVAICIGNGLMVEAGGGTSKCISTSTSTGMVWIRPLSWRNNLVAILKE